MSTHSVRVNTFVQENYKSYIDPVSKVFFTSDAVLGFFRLPLTRSKKTLFYVLSVFYVIFVNLFILIEHLIFSSTRILTIITKTAQYSKYLFCCILAFVCIKKLQLFFSMLNRFDLNVGCRPKISRQCIHNLMQTIVTVISLCSLYAIPSLMGTEDKTSYSFLLLNISYAVEVDSYGHLLSILVPRLKLINYYIETSMSNVNTESSSLLNEFVSLKRGAVVDLGHYRMKKLMDLYHVIVEAYDFLIDAIKWQLLVIIITSFISTLGFLYIFSLNIIKDGEDPMEIAWLSKLGIALLAFIPMFSPCYFGDQVHLEVKRLRELLACRLYENKLDKSGRSIARALLAFTETRDLSFRLLRMLNIDISLPFKFMGLLVTYLIILLQFDKVLGTDVSITNGTID